MLKPGSATTATKAAGPLPAIPVDLLDCRRTTSVTEPPKRRSGCVSPTSSICMSHISFRGDRDHPARLGSSLLWGVADFLGGKTSRSQLTVLVVLISQLAGLVSVSIVALAAGSFSASPGYLPWAVGAGLAGASAVCSSTRVWRSERWVWSHLSLQSASSFRSSSEYSAVRCRQRSVSRHRLAIAGVVVAARPAESGARTDRHVRSVLYAVGAAAGSGCCSMRYPAEPRIPQ